MCVKCANSQKSMTQRETCVSDGHVDVDVGWTMPLCWDLQNQPLVQGKCDGSPTKRSCRLRVLMQAACARLKDVHEGNVVAHTLDNLAIENGYRHARDEVVEEMLLEARVELGI